MSRYVSALASLVLLLASSAYAQNEVGIKRGSEAPGAAVEDLDGNVVDLANYVGTKPVLLEFWASWCERCKALAPSMERAYEQYGDSVAFVVVAVGVGQSQRTVRRHRADHPDGYVFLYDKEGEAVRAYAAPTTSYVVIVDSTGRVAYTGVGGDQDLEAAVRDVLASDGTSG
jgi:cytochrome c biogenesis protein CcmG/thiol:disulfide interchange protein DsbE